jgi:hypothetical protein
VHTGFWSGNLRDKDHLVVPGIDGRIIFILDGDMCCIDQVQNRGGWSALVNAVMNLRVTKDAGNLLNR